MIKTIYSFFKISFIYIFALSLALISLYLMKSKNPLRAQTNINSQSKNEPQDFPDLPPIAPAPPSVAQVPLNSAAPTPTAVTPSATTQIPGSVSDDSTAIPYDAATMNMNKIEEEQNNLKSNSNFNFDKLDNKTGAKKNIPLDIVNYTDQNYSTIKNASVYVGDPDSTERDPFRRPLYLLKAEDEQQTEASAAPSDRATEVEKLESIRRWPLKNYRLVGIIWNVAEPKALFFDPTGVLHVLKRNYRIGDRNGVLTSIDEGSVIVSQEGVPIVVSMDRSRKP